MSYAAELRSKVNKKLIKTKAWKMYLAYIKAENHNGVKMLTTERVMDIYGNKYSGQSVS